MHRLYDVVNSNRTNYLSCHFQYIKALALLLGHTLMQSDVEISTVQTTYPTNFESEQQ